MSTRQRPVDRGARRGTRNLREILDEFLRARVTAGITQQAVARSVGISRAQYGRLERSELPDVGMILLSRIATVLGLDLSAKVFPAGPALRDIGQVRLLERLRVRVAASWQWALEVPMPIPGDQRAWDAVCRNVHVRVGVEAVVRSADSQATIRRAKLKLRDGAADRLIILVADTRANREAVRQIRESMVSAFPVSQRRALAAMAAGDRPGGDSMIVL